MTLRRVADLLVRGLGRLGGGGGGGLKGPVGQFSLGVLHELMLSNIGVLFPGVTPSSLAKKQGNQGKKRERRKTIRKGGMQEV